MEFLSSKWFIGVFIVLILLVVLVFTGKKSVHTEVSIERSKEDVWKILTDFTTVKEWNKVLVPIDGTLELGNKVKYEFFQDEDGKPVVMEATVKQIEVGNLINQKGGTTGILTFNHQYILSESGNSTTVQIKEEYRGVMVNFWNPQPVEKAYYRLLLSLKQKAEEKLNLR